VSSKSVIISKASQRSQQVLQDRLHLARLFFAQAEQCVGQLAFVPSGIFDKIEVPLEGMECSDGIEHSQKVNDEPMLCFVVRISVHEKGDNGRKRVLGPQCASELRKQFQSPVLGNVFKGRGEAQKKIRYAGEEVPVLCPK
jgi:hypothetical protein